MGVSGCGKTSVGRALAQACGGVFEDADDFHSMANKDKMRAGIPLNDDDRWPWFDSLRQRIEQHRTEQPRQIYVLACSALKAAYRQRLRSGDGDQALRFLHLAGSRELIFSRLSQRRGHYMPASLLESQLAILEPSADLLSLDINGSIEQITAVAAAQLGFQASAKEL
jgi:gluconokinase